VKRAASTVLRLVISFGLLALLAFLFRNQLGACLRTIRQADLKFLLLAFLTYILFIWVSAWRWQILLNAQGLHFSAWFLARVFTLGLFFCKLLPTSIGGDVMRIAYTVKPGKGPEAFSATFLDRLIGFESLTFLAVLMALFIALRRSNALSLGKAGLTGPAVILLLLLILLFLLIITVVLFNDRCHNIARRIFSHLPFQLHRLTQTLDRAYDAVKRYRHQPGPLALSFILGIGVQATLSLAWFFCAGAVRATVPLGYYFVFIPPFEHCRQHPDNRRAWCSRSGFSCLFYPGLASGQDGC